MIRLFQKANELGLLNKISIAISILESEGSSKNDIKITTSFIIKRFIEEEIQKRPGLNLEKIFGVDISFDHFSNDIVIYDKANACIDEKFKIVIGV